MRKNEIVKKLEKYISDSPDNELIFFSAIQGEGRFFLDIPENPAALIAVAESDEPICFLRTLDQKAKINWLSLLTELSLPGALAGESTLIRKLSARLGYGTPLEEVVFVQQGFLHPTEELAKKITRYDKEQFTHLEKNARWLWGKFGTIENALSSFPAFGIFHDGIIVALAMVCSFSMSYANIGYWVLEEFRNQSFGTRCAAALCAYLNQNDKKAIAITSETHLPSISVIHKLGMKEYCRYSLAPNLSDGED